MTATLRRLCALLCLLVFAVSAMATPTSPLRFKRLGAIDSDELSILALMQDRRGFIWIGTHSGGLYRYNGYHAVKYTSNTRDANSLPHDRVSTVFEDKTGTIWVGTQNGLARYNPQTNDFTRFLPPPGPSTQRIVKAIISDGKDGMWLATWGGLQHFSPASGAFTLYRHDPKNPASLASNDLNSIAMDEKGGIYAATWPGGLDYLPAGAKGFVHHRVDSDAAPDAKLNIVRSLHYGRDRTLWIGTENGVVTWNAGTDWSTRKRIASPATRINYLYGDRNGTVWAATLASGLLRWDQGAAKAVHYVHRANDSNSLPSDYIRAVMHDRSGMLWIGSFTDGISLVNLNSQGFERYIPFDVEAHNLRPDNSLRSIEGAPGGRLWLSGNSGLSLFDPATGEVLRSYRAAPGRTGVLSNDIVYSLYQQPQGPLWVGTSAGLNRLDHPDQPFKTVSFGDAGADFINTIAPGAGGILWLGTGNQVIRYDTAAGTWTNYAHDPNNPDSRSVNSSTVILEDSSGRVWMGSEWSGGGLDLLDPKTGKFRHLRHEAGKAGSLADDNVGALYQDPKGRLWVGTAKGLNQVITGADGSISFRSFDGKDSVGAVKILAIGADQAGHIWMSTASGLLRLDPASGKVSRYTTADGLSEGFAVGAAYAADNGKLYFGGVKGMTGVSPELVRSVSVKPEVAITDIAVFNQSLKSGKYGPGIKLEGGVNTPSALTLSVQESVFTIEFAALHYSDPGRNSYAYRLQGFDRDWVHTDATRRSATYTNLNPGEYVFSVKAANHQGVWNDTPTSLSIVILPPWYHTWWFRTLMALLAFGLLTTAYRARVQHLTRRQIQLEAMVAARTHELEDSNAQLAALSSTDGLTGISNRRGFDAALDSEWRRGSRNGYTLALAMLDVDHFKAYNDHYGHQAGDRCLRQVAELIATHGRRTSDVVARYGGEEFALLSPATDATEAMEAAREICAELAKLALPHAKSPHGVVTISIGVATVVPDEAASSSTLIDRADRALYKAKKSGRNRALLADPADLTVAAHQA
ncbi:diguanylate cyclase [Massilia sp. PAMC28688]|uniref:ligand-binding sensor domain-containing diguanylate cyclase n=1 Tax=Massilia sp. PAMC28688 TaxID=2861283 RepID=UPI001E5A5B9D|nr:diguanylate cyclase [Massilia sp. PAMC28688]